MLFKPPITRANAKRHLGDVRCQYQKQMAVIIEECERIRKEHKMVFDRQWETNRRQKTFVVKMKPVIPAEEELPMVEEFINDSSESLSIVLDNSKSRSISSNTRIVSSRKKQRCVSVSPVASIDRRVNRVYEQWPDYSEISQIVGYRIEKPAPVVPPSPPPPVVPSESKKGKKSLRFATAAKQVTEMSAVEKEIIKAKPIVQEPALEIFVRKDIPPKLPTMLCPGSEFYSKRIRTRQWLFTNDFTSQSLPLI